VGGHGQVRGDDHAGCHHAGCMTLGPLLEGDFISVFITTDLAMSPHAPGVHPAW
jgi:hypothetical protein